MDGRKENNMEIYELKYTAEEIDTLLDKALQIIAYLEKGE